MKIINLEVTYINKENSGDNDFTNKLIDCDGSLFKNSTFNSITEKWVP